MSGLPANWPVRRLIAGVVLLAVVVLVVTGLRHDSTVIPAQAGDSAPGVQQQELPTPTRPTVADPRAHAAGDGMAAATSGTTQPAQPASTGGATGVQTAAPLPSANFPVVAGTRSSANYLNNKPQVRALVAAGRQVDDCIGAIMIKFHTIPNMRAAYINCARVSAQGAGLVFDWATRTGYAFHTTGTPSYRYVYGPQETCIEGEGALKCTPRKG